MLTKEIERTLAPGIDFIIEFRVISLKIALGVFKDLAELVIGESPDAAFKNSRRGVTTSGTRHLLLLVLHQGINQILGGLIR